MKKPCGCAREDGPCRCPMAGKCAWPKGCHQEHVSCCGRSSSGRHDLCSYHDGIVAGEISLAPRAPAGLIASKNRMGVKPGSLLTDEQLELERILLILQEPA